MTSSLDSKIFLMSECRTGTEVIMYFNHVDVGAELSGTIFCIIDNLKVTEHFICNVALKF